MTDNQDSRASMKALLRLLWAAIVRYKGMVSAMLLFGFLEAAFTKLPFVLVKPLMAEMGASAGKQPLFPPVWLSPIAPKERGTLDRYADDFNVWFHDVSDRMVHALGLDFGHSGMGVVVSCGIVAVVCGLLGSVTIYFVQTVSRMFAIQVVADLRTDLARHFLALPLRFFGRHTMGDMISKITNHTQVMQRSFELASDNVIVDPLMVLNNIVILAFFVPQAIWVLIVMVPVMAYPLYRQGRQVSSRSKKSLQALSSAVESLNQILSGIRTVKAFQLEDVRIKEYDDNTKTFLDRTRKMLRLKGRSMGMTFVSYQAGFAALLVLLGYVVLVKQQIGFDDVALVIMPLATTYQHIKRLTRSYHVLMESAGALQGVQTILHTPVDQTQVGGEPMPSVRGDVELRDVWFAYDEEPVLRGLNLTVKAGQTVAFVGPSGGGKSTTMDLLLRFHDPQRGAILVDGKDLRSVKLADYRAHTAVVSQQPFLFNTTLRANIAYGKPGATQAQIEAAAKAANIHDFIVSQPLGYDTIAGERGCNVSGGQMQRITIARAILRDPAILFLDEATSALDSENEEIVQTALDNLRRGRTSFVIAHRLSTIVDADLIVVIEQGRVVEVGSHAQLLARGGAYKRMRDLQSA